MSCSLDNISISTYFSIIRFIPESLRWLLANGKVTRAEKIIKSIAEANKKDIDEEEIDLKGLKCDEPQKVSLLKLFSGDYRRLLKIFILTNLLW